MEEPAVVNVEEQIAIRNSDEFKSHTVGFEVVL